MMTSDEPRRVRVFVSSTFRDMQEERDELAKRVFPQLRKLCDERDIEWGEVDLRWGITEEQSKRGETLQICLAEIERCRPHFIGILGERYGWVPEEISKDLSDQQPWLNEHRESSVTALEILHGVLNNLAMADRSFFYFRDKDYLSKIPEQQRPDFLELPTEEELAKYPPDESARRAEVRKGKLENLKERIRKSGLPVRENYHDPQEFGTLVFNDLKAVIEQFPQPIRLDALGREAAAHETFAKSRFGVYIERQEYFDRFDAHADGDWPPLVILGESGSGKSALLAHWVKRYQERMQPVAQTTNKKSLFKSLHSLFTGSPSQIQQPLVLIHFIGATVESTDYVAMLRRIMTEFKRHFSIEQEIPEKPEELRTAFPNWLHMAAARGKVILVIDALNQLDDRDGAPDLVWLPPVIPTQVRLILSALPGRSLNNLKERNWPTMTVEALNHDERRELIRSYLAQYRRTPSDKLVDKLSCAPQSANPLYLRSLLEELRLYGDHFTLMAEADRYLKSEKIDDLFELILARWETDYNRDRPELVQDVMTLLWAARRGLSEPELLELLSEPGNPLPAALWSPLSLAAEKALVNRSGLLNFFHSYLRIAVENRYLTKESERQCVHFRIAQYFINQPTGQRRIEELPWQLAATATEWNQLVTLLGNPTFFMMTWKTSEYDVKRYWVQIETGSAYRMVVTYRDLLQNPAKAPSMFLWELRTMLYETGHLTEASSLGEYLIRSSRQLEDVMSLQASLGNQALILKDHGDLEGAINLLKEQAQICREQGDILSLSAVLGNQANIYYSRGEFEKAMILYKEMENISRELKDSKFLQASLGNQANIYYSRGEYEKAIILYKEQERLCRELGDISSLQAAFGNQANIFKARGDLDGAMRLYKEQAQICRELGNLFSLQISLGNQALILKAHDDLDGAMALHKEEEEICRKLGNLDSLQRSLGNQALILKADGDLDGAMTLHKKEEEICRKLGNLDSLQRSLGNQAGIFFDRGIHNESMALLKEQEEICRKLGKTGSLQGSLGNQALILKARGDLDGAMKLLKEQEEICRQLGIVNDLAISLINQALILSQQDRQREALTAAEEANQLTSSHGYKALAKQIGPILDGIRNPRNKSNGLEKENQYNIWKIIESAKIDDILGLSIHKFTEIERKITEMRGQSSNAREMIEKLFQQKSGRYKGSTGFQLMMVIMIEEFGTVSMKSKMMLYVDSVSDLFDIDKDTRVANKIIISQFIKTANDFPDLIKRFREFETKNDSDREYFTCGLILGNIITAEMLSGERK